MADKFKLNIISPEKKFLEGDCEFLEFVSTEGELGIYAKHIPLTTILEPCVMRIHNDGEIKKAAILGGFVEILQEKVTVLACNSKVQCVCFTCFDMHNNDIISK